MKRPMEQNVPSVPRGRRPVRVEIYVSAHCPICNYSHEVAAVIRRDFPEVELKLVDVGAADQPIPDVVFATPTYLLNGRVWSLGNPSYADVQARLSEALAPL